MALTEKQESALRNICERYHVDFNPEHYPPGWDLPPGYVNGWVGGITHSTKFSSVTGDKVTIFIGCSPDGEISS